MERFSAVPKWSPSPAPIKSIRGVWRKTSLIPRICGLFSTKSSHAQFIPLLCGKVPVWRAFSTARWSENELFWCWYPSSTDEEILFVVRGTGYSWDSGAVTHHRPGHISWLFFCLRVGSDWIITAQHLKLKKQRKCKASEYKAQKHRQQPYRWIGLQRTTAASAERTSWHTVILQSIQIAVIPSHLRVTTGSSRSKRSRQRPSWDLNRLPIRTTQSSFWLVFD